MSNLTWRQIAVLLGCLLATATLVVGIYGLLTGNGTDPASPRPRTSRAANPIPQSARPTVTPSAAPLPQTTDPVAHARAIAQSLFDWVTASGLLPTDYTATVLADADPSGEETPSLITDVAAYVPTLDQWLDLGAMHVRQTITIDKAFVPHSWAGAVEQAHGQLRPGTTAVTITGTRHRTGIWDGTHAASSYPVSFTVFVACPPAFDRCHLLRLSQLDNPLK